MTRSTRRPSARLAGSAAGVLLLSGLLLSAGGGSRDVAALMPTTTAATEATAATAATRCPRPRITYSTATGQTTRFGWLLAPGSNGTLRRDALQYNVIGGTVVCDSLSLSNTSKHAITVRLYGADAYNTNNGGFAFTAYKDKPRGVGTWIRLPFTRVTVPAGAAASIPVVVQVPTNVTPGDAAGGVVAQDTKVRAGKAVAGASVGVRAGVGVRLYASVAGLRHPRLTLTGLKLRLDGGLRSRLLGAPSATVSYQVGNAGNTRLTPRSSGVLQTRTRTYALKSRQFGELLPGSRTAVVTEKVRGPGWRGLLGRVKARVTVTAPGARPVTAEVTAWRTPWLLLAGAGSLIALLTAAGWAGVRHRGTAATAAAPEEREPVGA